MLEFTQLDSGKSTMRYLPPKDTAGLPFLCQRVQARATSTGKDHCHNFFCHSLFSPLTLTFPLFGNERQHVRYGSAEEPGHSLGSFGLRVLFAGAFSALGSASALGLRPGFAYHLCCSFLRSGLCLFGAVFFPPYRSCPLRPCGCAWRALQIQGAHGAAGVIVMLCSNPCIGFLWVRTALLWTAPEPPNSASSLFRISL